MEKAPMTDCVFCRVVAGEAESFRVHETEHAYAFLDLHPVSEYHTLVVPKRHHRDVFEIPEGELLHVVSAVKHVVDLFQRRLGIENAQIVTSSGAEAQQDVFHLHFHIVPRRAGDGQDVRWTPRPELCARFPDLLDRLNGPEAP